MIARLPATVSALVTLSTAACAVNTADAPMTDQSLCRASAFVAPFDQVDPCAGEDVLLAAVRALFTYRPLRQRDPAEAVRSASPLLDDHFAAQASTTVPVWVPIITARWQQLREKRAEIHPEVRLTADDHPPDTPTRLARVLGIEFDLPAEGVISFPVYATVTRAGDRHAWRLAGLQVPQ
ncbi:hypothetical protein [Nocardia shimofusensis]|uniref:hypothetical protein n=1 Tax=Nocardia shimofusensis TaxID=228596 RepID=UPI000AB4AB4C|nr:hypothetical protein [Nocardia shimofusensis]